MKSLFFFFTGLLVSSQCCLVVQKLSVIKVLTTRCNNGYLKFGIWKTTVLYVWIFAPNMFSTLQNTKCPVQEFLLSYMDYVVLQLPVLFGNLSLLLTLVTCFSCRVCSQPDCLPRRIPLLCLCIVCVPLCLLPALCPMCQRTCACFMPRSLSSQVFYFIYH